MYRHPVVTKDVPQWRTDFKTLQEEYHWKIGRSIQHSDTFWNVDTQNLDEEEEDEEEEEEEKEEEEEEEEDDDSDSDSDSDGSDSDSDSDDDSEEETSAAQAGEEEDDEDEDDDDDFLFNEELSYKNKDPDAFDKVWDAELNKDDQEDQSSASSEIFDTFGGFNFASRITEDESDLTSINRKLDQKLYLIVQEENDSDLYSFPSKRMNPKKHSNVTHNDTEPIFKKYAMQAIKEKAGNGLAKYMLPQVGGAPVGFHWKTFESSSDENSKKNEKYFGDEIYFFKSAVHMKNDEKWPTVKSGSGGHLWVTKEELVEHLNEKDDEEYLNHLLMLL